MNSDNDSVWRELSLGEAAKITMGQSPPSSTYNTEGFGLPFYQGKAEFGFRYPVVEKWCSEPQRIAEAGSVLVSVRAPVGDVNIADTRCCIGRGLAAVSGLADTSVTDYLYFYLQYHKAAIESKGTGSTFKAINKGTLHDFFVLLPPLPEQRRIAAVLNAIQEAIAAQEDVIAAARHFKRSLMQRLFTYGPGREPAPTKETEIGEIPAHWEVRPLSDLVRKKITDGTHKTPKYVEDGAAFVSATNLRDGRVDFSDCKFISWEEHGLLTKRCQPEPGDVLLSKVGTIGLVALVPPRPEFSIFVQIALIKPNQNVDSTYLAYCLSIEPIQHQIDHRSSQSTMKYIGVGKIAEIEVPLPPLAEQDAIAEMLSVADAKIAAEEDRKTALETLFKSMLHQLMTGQIRLLTDEGLPLPKN